MNLLKLRWAQEKGVALLTSSSRFDRLLGMILWEASNYSHGHLLKLQASMIFLFLFVVFAVQLGFLATAPSRYVSMYLVVIYQLTSQSYRHYYHHHHHHHHTPLHPHLLILASVRLPLTLPPNHHHLALYHHHLTPHNHHYHHHAAPPLPKTSTRSPPSSPSNSPPPTSTPPSRTTTKTPSPPPSTTTSSSSAPCSPSSARVAGASWPSARARSCRSTGRSRRRGSGGSVRRLMGGGSGNGGPRRKGKDSKEGEGGRDGR